MTPCPTGWLFWLESFAWGLLAFGVVVGMAIAMFVAIILGVGVAHERLARLFAKPAGWLTHVLANRIGERGFAHLFMLGAVATVAALLTLATGNNAREQWAEEACLQACADIGLEVVKARLDRCECAPPQEITVVDLEPCE